MLVVLHIGARKLHVVTGGNALVLKFATGGAILVLKVTQTCH